jgi:hypothetical protein
MAAVPKYYLALDLVAITNLVSELDMWPSCASSHEDTYILRTKHCHTFSNMATMRKYT